MFTKLSLLLPFWIGLVLAGIEVQEISSGSCNGCQTLRLDAILEILDNQETATLEAIKSLRNHVENLQAQDQALRDDVENLQRAAILQRQWQPCDCNLMGSVNETCDSITNRCFCYEKYIGRLCNECQNGLYNFPKCTDCGCNVAGTRGAVCDKTDGECFCKDGFTGVKCEQCKGQFVAGDNCDRCQENYFGYPECKACACDPAGSTSQQCDLITGQCPCSEYHRSLQCNQCIKGRWGFPECLATYDADSIGPQALIFGGFTAHPQVYDYEYEYNYHYRTIRPLIDRKRSAYHSTVNSHGQLPSTSTVNGVEALYLDETMISEMQGGYFQFDSKMVATLNGSCIYCKEQSSGFECYSVVYKDDDEGTTGSVPAPGFAVDESSFLVGTDGGIYSVRTDYHVDVTEEINKPWKNVRSSSFSLMDKFGSLRCVAKLNETTIVGLSAKKSDGSGDYENLIIMFFMTQESRWKAGKRISNNIDNVKALLNCQVNGENPLLVEMVRSTSSESVYFYSIDTMSGSDWDSDWYGIKSDFDPSYGTLVRFNDGLLYTGGVSSKDSDVFLYKHKDSKKWMKLHQRLNNERINPGVCVFS